MNDDTLVLYIIMRTDLDSMNPGKAMAQANHAFGALKKRIRSNIIRQADYLTWQKTTHQDFGTVIVLGGNEGGDTRSPRRHSSVQAAGRGGLGSRSDLPDPGRRGDAYRSAQYLRICVRHQSRVRECVQRL